MGDLGQGIVALIAVATIIVACCGILIFLLAASRESAIRRRLHKAIDPELEFISRYDWSFIALNFERARIVLGKNRLMMTCDFSDLLQVDVVRNEDMITTSTSGSLAARAAVGGALFGPFGAAVGALTARSRAQSELKKLSIRIICASGTYQLLLFQRAIGSAPAQKEVDEVEKRADEVYGAVVRAMHFRTRRDPLF